MPCAIALKVKTNIFCLYICDKDWGFFYTKLLFDKRTYHNLTGSVLQIFIIPMTTRHYLAPVYTRRHAIHRYMKMNIHNAFIFELYVKVSAFQYCQYFCYIHYGYIIYIWACNFLQWNLFTSPARKWKWCWEYVWIFCR